MKNSDSEIFEWEKERNGRIDSNEAESAEDEQAGDDFKCESCDFTSTWKGGFNIHLGRKHKLIPHLDGGDFSSELNELDDWYEGSKHYWKSGYLGQGYQAFIDAKKVVDESSLDEEEKKIHIDAILEARKTAIGEHYKYFPPWD